MSSAKLPPVVLTADERATLQHWTRQRRTTQATALRARIILAASTGATNTAIAAELGVVISTVGKWRRRFLQARLAGLLDAPRVGTPRTITDAEIEAAIRTTLESRPKGAPHWSTRSLAATLGLSQSTVSRMWRAFGLQPHGVPTFTWSTDPQFSERAHEIVGVYIDPPDRALVLAVDEKSHIPVRIDVLERPHLLLTMRPAPVERRPADDAEHGTASLFRALDAHSREVSGRRHALHRHRTFRRFLDEIDHNVPAMLDVHVILDAGRTRPPAAFGRWLAHHSRVHVHAPPTNASWLDLVERWLSALTRTNVPPGAPRPTVALEAAIRHHLADPTTPPGPFVWTTAASGGVAGAERSSPRTSGSVSG